MSPEQLFFGFLGGYGAVSLVVFGLVQGVKWGKWLVENS